MASEESEEKQMKREMTLGEVCDYYKKSNIARTDEGFELPDKLRGFALVIPHEFYRFSDGEPIDLAMMLVDRTGWMRRELLGSLEVCTPVSMEYSFGIFVPNDDWNRFLIQDPMETVADAMAVLVEAKWDLRQGVSNEGWVSAVEKNWSGLICHQKTISGDVYGTRGKQVWILHATSFMTEIMDLKHDFYTWQRQMIECSDKILRKFEAEKAQYQEKIVECLNALPGRIHWIVAAEEEELWPKYDADRELWVKNESDWQITRFDDCLEIRSRGGSPGVISVETVRYDAVGLRICQDLLRKVK